ncbi:hypothetical protein [Rhizorhabdus sp.]|uniref:hypothetical protein n=1 Tax=Rhizorhabdus sp. TaxID=1968843 RepID=UPI0035B28682
MSTGQWPAGTLRRAALAAYQLRPDATAAELARMLGSTPARVRTTLHQQGIKPRLEGRVRIVWTPDMKAALLRGLLKGRSANAIARTLGVSSNALFSGAVEIIRDLHEQKGPSA